MSGQCVSWMVVSSDTTRIDTEALVDDVLFLRRIREALDSQLDAAHSLNQVRTSVWGCFATFVCPRCTTERADW